MNQDRKDTDGARRLLLRYMHHLNTLGIKGIQRGTRLQHVKWMCDYAESSIEDLARINRWLGFIQAWLVSENIYSLEECKLHSRELLYPDNKTDGDLIATSSAHAMNQLALAATDVRRCAIGGSVTDHTDPIGQKKEFSNRLVWVDLETTGIGDDDLILEIEVIVTDNDLNELSSVGGLIRPCNPHLLSRSSSKRMNSFPCCDQHFDSGLVDELIRLDAAAALPDLDSMGDRILRILSDHGIVPGMDPDLRPPLCGSSVHFDRRFIRKYMPELHDVLHYRNIDVSSVRELARRLVPDLEIPKPESEHRALSDLHNSIELLRFFRKTGFLGMER